MTGIVLVTVGTFNLDNINVTQSLVGLDVTQLETLVFHSSSDTDVVVARELSKLDGVVDKIFYVNKDIDSLYYCLFDGLGADIINSDDLLESNENFEYLVENYKETGMTLESPVLDVEKLTKAVDTLTNGDETGIMKQISNKFWLSSFDTAVKNVTVALERSGEANGKLKTLLTDINDLLVNLENKNDDVAEEIQKLQNILDDTSKIRTSSPFQYPTHKLQYMTSKVLYIRALSPCRFLNSFILSYQDYLKMHRQKSSKVLFIMPKLKSLMMKYDSIPRLANDSISLMDLSTKGDIFVTYEPNKSVLDTFFSQQNVNYFIVIDLTYNDILISGYNVVNYFAIGGLGDIKRHKLPLERIFIPMVTLKKGSGHSIPFIKGYIASPEPVRKTMYYEKCKETFEFIDASLK